MTRFYTGTGDGGVSILGKKKLKKTDPFFAAVGSLDELNARIGHCRVEARMKFRKVAGDLLKIQETLFIAQAQLASQAMGLKSRHAVSAGKTKELEEVIESVNRQVPELTKFIIPGNSELESRLEIARTVARNAERSVIRYVANGHSDILPYLNRVSSALFALARYVNWKLKIKESNPKYI